MKEKLIQSTLILMIGGLITKILGMTIKMVMARNLGAEGMGMYMLILPTFIFFINMSQMGLPLALSKLKEVLLYLLLYLIRHEGSFFVFQKSNFYKY